MVEKTFTEEELMQYKKLVSELSEDPSIEDIRNKFENNDDFIILYLSRLDIKQVDNLIEKLQQNDTTNQLKMSEAFILCCVGTLSLMKSKFDKVNKNPQKQFALPKTQYLQEIDKMVNNRIISKNIKNTFAVLNNIKLDIDLKEIFKGMSFFDSFNVPAYTMYSVINDMEMKEDNKISNDVCKTIEKFKTIEQYINCQDYFNKEWWGVEVKNWNKLNNELREKLKLLKCKQEQELKLQQQRRIHEDKVNGLCNLILNGIRANFGLNQRLQQQLEQLDGETVYDFLTSNNVRSSRDRGNWFSRLVNGKKNRYHEFCNYITDRTGLQISDTGEVANNNDKQQRTNFINRWKSIQTHDKIQSLANIFQTSGLCCA